MLYYVMSIQLQYVYCWCNFQEMYVIALHISYYVGIILNAFSDPLMIHYAGKIGWSLYVNQLYS